MKKILLVFFCLLLVVGILALQKFRQSTDRVFSEHAAPLPTIIPTSIPKIVTGIKETHSLFVPYWAVTSKVQTTPDITELIYFGVSVTGSGIDTNEPGYKNLKKFIFNTNSQSRKLLAVRMIDSDVNLKVLGDKNIQKKVISNSITLARENGFSGIVLDLEVSGLPLESLEDQIDNFTKTFYQSAKADNLIFAQTIYGDTFYRLRPFDVKTLVSYTDSIMVMAYDFHKAYGNPGPNFPLNGQEQWGYDFKKMMDDFLQFVPANKLTVIFGLFGYDWTVDDKDIAKTNATPITDQEATDKFLSHCPYATCSNNRDATSSEMRIRYRDNDSNIHDVWLEDMKSVTEKQQYAKSRGVGSFSYWAYSYY